MRKKVKTIVTMTVIALFAVLALPGDISPDNVMVIVSTVVAFYFGTQYEKSGGLKSPPIPKKEFDFK